MHFSYSSIKNAEECAYRFKLMQIDKINVFKNSIDTVFGTLLHKCIQDILLQKQSKKEAAVYFHRAWKKFALLYRKFLDISKVASYLKSALAIIDKVEYAFEGYETLSVEELLYEPATERYPQHNFKGFIDLVLKKDDRIIIADLKTAKSAYFFKKYLNTMKKYQLTYYKSYYSKKHTVSLKNIDVVYVVLEKDPASKDPIRFIEDTSGPKKISNCLSLLDKTISMVESGKFYKNRTQCFNPYTKIACPFFQTIHCT